MISRNFMNIHIILINQSILSHQGLDSRAWLDLIFLMISYVGRAWLKITHDIILYICDTCCIVYTWRQIVLSDDFLVTLEHDLTRVVMTSHEY